MIRPTLAEIALSLPTDKGTLHRAYLPVYETILDRGTIDPVLELGVWRGGSLALWERWFSRAPVIGVDIETHPALERFARAQLIVADAYADATVEKLRAFGPYALIVDDGPHTVWSQRFFVRRYPELLAPGGVAVVEDIQSDADLAEIVAAVPEGYTAGAVDLRPAGGAPDDLLLVVRPAL